MANVSPAMCRRENVLWIDMLISTWVLGDVCAITIPVSWPVMGESAQAGT